MARRQPALDQSHLGWSGLRGFARRLRGHPRKTRVSDERSGPGQAGNETGRVDRTARRVRRLGPAAARPLDRM